MMTKSKNEILIIKSSNFSDEIEKLSHEIYIISKDNSFKPDSKYQIISDVSEIKKVNDVTLFFSESDGLDFIDVQFRKLVDANSIKIIILTKNSFYRPPIFLVSIPKSGTHLLTKLAGALGYKRGKIDPDIYLPGHWYSLQHENTHTPVQSFMVDGVDRAYFGNRHHPFPRTNTLFVFRHPADVLVSEANYYHKNSNTVFGGWLKNLPMKDRLIELFGDNGVIGRFADRFNGFRGWLKFPNVLALAYEELVGSAGGGDDELQARTIWAVMLKLRAQGKVSEIASVIYDRESPTFSKGQIGQSSGNNEIPQESSLELEQIAQTFHYLEGTRTCTAWEDRIIRKEPAQTNVEPLPPFICAPSLLGFNFVRFRDQIYAVEQRLGDVFSRPDRDELLAGFMSGTSIEDVRVLVTAQFILRHQNT